MMNIKIPHSSIFRPIVKRFTATFGNPTLGKYNFGTLANQNVTILPISQGNLFYISILNFSASISESAYLENIEEGQDPQVVFLTRQNGINIFGGPQPLIKYLPENEVSSFFRSRQRGDALTATATGILTQSGSLVGPDSVTMAVALNVWEITDQKWIREFDGIPADQIGNVQIPWDIQKRI